MPRIAACGWLMMMGAASRLPLTPWLESVKVPPRTSAGESFAARARAHQVVEAARGLEQVACLGIAQHRHEQSYAVHRGRDPDVNRLVDLECRVRPATVGLGNRADRRYRGLHEVSRERERHAALRELLALAGAAAQHGGHVGLEHRRDVRRGMQQALHHVLGDAPAHRGMRHAPSVQRGLRGRRGGRRRRRIRGGGGWAPGARPAGALRAAACSTSSTVMRPPSPLPGTADGSSPCSASRRRTAGLSALAARAADEVAPVTGAALPAAVPEAGVSAPLLRSV